MDTPCCICEILIAGRRPQFMQCVSCSLHFHRQCMPHGISSYEYVRMKKNNEAFNFRCVKCVGGVIVSAPGSQQTQPKKQRGRPRKNPLPAALPEPDVRPTFLAIATASFPDTSSPMDIDGPGLLTLPLIGVSPIDTLPVVIRVEARVAVTFTITPVGDGSSRFEIPVPLAEDTVELRQPIAIMDVANRDDDLESSDDDEPACKAVFPTVKPVGCSFHLTQSFYRNIKLIGLGPSYRKDSQTRKTCRKLLSLYLLPAEKIAKRFQTISDECNGLLLRFCNYVEQNYINSTVWPPQNWSMFMQHVRTNNNVEGTHNNLKAVAGPASISLVTFLIKMKEEADKIPMTAKLLSQKQALRRLNKNAESKQHHLTALWDSYNRTENRLSSKELLEALGKLTKQHSKAELKELGSSNALDESD